MNKHGRAYYLLAASVAAVAIGQPALAQDEPSEADQTSAASDEVLPEIDTQSGYGSDAIIVTARRVEESLQDVPISITVFNQEQLAERNVVNAQDLAAYTPSLSANSNFGSENSTFAIRGFVQDIGTPPSVGVYFADVVAPRGAAQGTPVGDGAGPGSFFDLANVQVLKGPQGTLFGRNTTGGAILIVPQKPTWDFEGYLEASVGNYDMRRLQGVINIPLGDQARFRLAIDDNRRDGYLNNTSGIGPRDYNDVNYTAVRASMAVDLTPELENYTIVSYSKSNTNGSIQKLTDCAPTVGFGAQFGCPQLADQQQDNDYYAVQANMPNPKSELEQWQIINTTTWAASDYITIKNIASYAELRNFQRSPLFGTNFSLGIPALGIPTQQVAFAFINPIPGFDTASQSTFTEELQIQGSTPDRRLTYQAGAYLEVSDPLNTVGAQSPTLIGCSDIDALQCVDVLGIGASAQNGFVTPIRIGGVNYTAGRTSFRNVGLYTQLTYDLTDRLSVTGGLRYTWDRQENTSERITYLFPVTPPFAGGATPVCTDLDTAPSCTETLRQKSSKPTWLASLEYKPVDDVMLYAKYARGYRAGGIFANSPQEYRIFQPEKVDSYEVGLKTEFYGSLRGNFNVAAFYNDFSNQQLQASFDPAPGANVAQTTGVVNAGRSRIWGVEVDTSVEPLEGLRLSGSYTYLNAEIKSVDPILVNDPNYVANAQINPGDSLTLSPENKFTLTAQYTLPINDRIGTVRLGATYSYTDEQRTTYLYNNPALVAAFGSDLGMIDDYGLLNLNINWDNVAGSPVDLSLFATNVTKEKYKTFVTGLGSAGFETATIGEPRMYGARLRYSFGQ